MSLCYTTFLNDKLENVFVKQQQIGKLMKNITTKNFKINAYVFSKIRSKTTRTSDDNFPVQICVNDFVFFFVVQIYQYHF